jgi:excinuclease ABC subunit A
LYPALARSLYHSRLYRCSPANRSTGLKHIDKVIDIDQSPIGRTPRSNPATYTKSFEIIRDLCTPCSPKARSAATTPGRFSFNVKGGRCETCEGDGVMRIEMHFLPDVYVECEACRGKRYNRETLEILFKGKSIADVLDMTVDEALRFFDNHPAHQSETLASVAGRARLRWSRPAGDHAVGRRGPAHQARVRTRQTGDRQESLHIRRTHHRPSLRRHPHAAARAPGAC